MQSEVETIIIDRGEEGEYLKCVDLVTTTETSDLCGGVVVRVDAIPHPFDPVEDREPVCVAIMRGSNTMNALCRAEAQKKLTEAIKTAPETYCYYIDF
jgi:hypothetical protein